VYVPLVIFDLVWLRFLVLWSVILPQRPNVAIVHPGNLIHGTKPVAKGERYNLIIWYKWSHKFEEYPKLPIELQLKVLQFAGSNFLPRINFQG